MSTFRNPVGPQPSSVYWRRRLVLLLGLIAVIIAIVLIVVRPGGGTGTPAPTRSPTPAAATAVAEACDPAKITVEGVVDATDYDPGVNPMMALVVKSTALEPCTIDAGSDVQEFRITSGDELIWTSKDCPVSTEARVQVLKPGVPVSTTPIPWDRTRSAVDTCGTERAQVIAEGATYRFGVSLGAISSVATTPFLLY
ncbi:MAG: hypothetical protein LH471_04245 [Salinibacterium sp.]|nr:hypothetical protein [Salinibacterium sp.]